MFKLTDVQIGLALRTARLAAGWSAKELAERCGLLATMVSKIESGKRSLTFAEAATICEVLGVRVDHFLSLAREVEPIALEVSTIRERLRHDLKMLENRTIRRAISANSTNFSELD